MTSADIVQELRAARPVAPPSLRTRVAELAERPRTPRPTLLERLGGRRLLVALPVATALVVAAGAGITLTRPDTGRESTAATTAPAASDLATAPGTALGAEAAAKAAGGVAADQRAQSFAATLTVRVADDGVADAAARALATAEDLGGFVVASQVTTGRAGYASITLKVPFARAQDAVLRLSRLGTIVAQDVRIDDLQESLDTLDAQIRRARAQLAAVLAQLSRDDLDAVERARLQARRDALRAELQAARAARAATAGRASLATVQLELTTAEASGVVPVPSRIDRTLDRALEVLAWEGALLAALLIVAAPLVLAGGLLWGGRRLARRRSDERLLAAP